MSLDVYLTHDPCDHCGHSRERWSANITHNLVPMAKAAGVYLALWRPEEIGIKTASELLPLLNNGLALLVAGPEHFAKLNPDNGWGSYGGLVCFVRRYISACEQWPNAKVSVSR